MSFRTGFATIPKKYARPPISSGPKLSRPQMIRGGGRPLHTIKPTVMPYYDPQRIPDLDRLEVRRTGERQGESAMTEREDVPAGDAGITGPGSVAPPTGRPMQPVQKEGLTGGQLALLAVLGFIVFGG